MIFLEQQQENRIYQKQEGKRALLQKRKCLICGENKTNVSFQKDKGRTYARWHKYKDGYICNTCRYRLRYQESRTRGLSLSFEIQEDEEIKDGNS